MMPNPKKIKPTTNQDYASIYEDNFVKRNDPVQLGQQAYTRQLSQGVQGSLQKPTAQPAVAQGSYYDRIPSIDRPVVSDTGFAFTGANPTFIDPDSNTLTGGSGGGAGTASGGSSGGYTSGAGTGYGVGEGAGSQTADGSLGSGGASGIETAISGQTAMIQEPVDKVVGAVGEAIRNPKTFLATAVTDAIFAAVGGEEKVVEKVLEEVTPFLQESVDPYFTGEKTVFDDMGIKVPGWLTNKNPTTVFGDYENAFSQAEGPSLPEKPGNITTGGGETKGGELTLEETPSLPGDTGDGETKNPNDIRTGGGQVKGGEFALEDADTGDYSQVVINNNTGSSSTGDLEEVSKGVTNQVQTRMTELTTQLTEQISQAEQFYAREYDRILNQIAMRGRQSQVGGFTGGIQEQIAQFASAAEIQQLNALAVERNNTIQGLQAQFANIPLQAQQYANELLSAELQNENIRTQALATLYTDVLNGVRTIEEAQAFADQYGLGNVQQLIDRVNKVQTEQTMLLNPNMDEAGNIVPHTIDSLRALFPNATEEELQAMLDQQDALDLTSFAQESQMIAEELNEALNTYNDEVLFEGGDSETSFGIVGAVSGAAVSAGLIAAGAAISGTGVGLPLGAIMIVGGLIVGALIGTGQGVGQDNVNEIIADFGKTSLFQGEGNVQSLFSGEATVSIKDPNVTASEAVSGYGQYNDKFTVNLNGTDHKMEGYQIVTLAISLKNKGVLDDYPEIKQKAQQIHDSMPAVDFSRILGGMTGNIINNVFKLYKQNFK